MSNAKIFPKGEFLFKEGDKASSLILIQSGSVQLCLAKPKKNIELAILGNGQIVGEQCLLGGVYQFSAVALIETKTIELPADMYKQQVESAPQALKTVIKSLTERMKTAFSELRSFKSDKDASPCPEDQIAKVFGSIYHTVHHKGEKDAKNPLLYSIDWPLFRQYSQRVFGESLKRLEQATNILVKMKLAKYEMGKPIDDPEGPDEIKRVQFFDLSIVESFFEFFQFYYFKGGKTDLLKSDELAMTFLNQFLKMAEGLTPDRQGVVSLEYSKVIEVFKSELSVNLNNDHFNRLESKALMPKRSPRTDGSVWLSFELKEFQTTAKIWRILREVEKWNEKGFVDVNEAEFQAKKKSGGPTCPQCAVDVAPQAKFCQECGAKLVMEKAG